MRRIVWIFILGLLLTPRAAMALSSDELLLLVNKREPAGRRLAEFYAQQRHVPDGRILELDLPTTDECTFDEYERGVVPPVREFLRANHLEQKVSCLVTFYGLPLRIANRTLSLEDREEKSELQNEASQADSALLDQVHSMESLAGQLDAGFKPGATGNELDDLWKRVNAATVAMRTAARGIDDPDLQRRLSSRLIASLQITGGRAQFYDELYPVIAHHPGITEAESKQWEQIKTNVLQAREDARPLLDRRFDPAARTKLREIVRQNYGLLRYDKLLHDMIDYFNAEQTGAALDSELSLLWWNYYPRAKWTTNLLFYDIASKPHAPVTMMVSRLDAPREQLVHDFIAAGIRTEKDGLKGRIVCDARGIAPSKDSYGTYDQTIRNFADLVKNKTKLDLLFDDKPDVLPPHSAKDVAVYIGWYSVGNYIPTCSFTPGAVGYHVASYELTSLRDPKCNGWCKGLLNDGIAATLGPVAEPYLGAFPNADDFFPLLLTGKLTLAEIFWRTERMASWQVCLIGDPLYTPYKTNPPLAMSDLPARLAPAVMPTTRPTTEPAW